MIGWHWIESELKASEGRCAWERWTVLMSMNFDDEDDDEDSDDDDVDDNNNN